MNMNESYHQDGLSYIYQQMPKIAQLKSDVKGFDYSELGISPSLYSKIRVLNHTDLKINFFNQYLHIGCTPICDFKLYYNNDLVIYPLKNYPNIICFDVYTVLQKERWFINMNNPVMKNSLKLDKEGIIDQMSEQYCCALQAKGQVKALAKKLT